MNTDISNKVAVLLANGFDEKPLSEIQKTLTVQDIPFGMVSSENGVVNGWADNAWGCFFTIETGLSTALASDFSSIIVMGGEKSIARLNKTAHTERFINSFVRSNKAMLVINDASELISSDDDSIIYADSSVSLTDALVKFTDIINSSCEEMDIAA
jgi:protease I